MMAPAADAKDGDVMRMPPWLLEIAKRMSAAAGISWQQWVRSCVRKEAAREESLKRQTKAGRVPVGGSQSSEVEEARVEAARLGFTVYRLATVLRMSETRLYRIFQGRVQPKPEELDRILSAVGLDPRKGKEEK